MSDNNKDHTQSTGLANIWIRVKSKSRMFFLGILQVQVEQMKAKIQENINEMKSDSEQERTVREHLSECLAEFQEVSYLIDNLRTDGPAKALIMVTRRGEAMDILSEKIIDQNEAFNQILDNYANNN